MSKPIKYPFLRTPRATAAYTWLEKPDTAFGDSKYKITLVFNKDDMSTGTVERGTQTLEGPQWIQYILDLCEKHGVANVPGVKGCPVKDGDKMFDKDGNPRTNFENSWVLQLKSGFKPSMVDTAGNKLPSSVPILNGDIVKAMIVPAYREVSGNRYLSLYLNNVCLVEKRVTNTLDSSVFGEEDGYVVPSGSVNNEEETSVTTNEEYDF
jgi:hypothetical protein